MFKKQIPFPSFHPLVNEVSESLYKSGHYTSALLKASVRLEEELKAILKTHIPNHELSGQALLAKLLRYRKEESKELEPYLQFYNLSTADGKDKQINMTNLFCGFMGVIRNELAHVSENLEDIEALYGLNMVSYLFYKLDQVNSKLEPKIRNKPTKKVTESERKNFEEFVHKLIKTKGLDDLGKILTTSPEITATMFSNYVETLLLEKIDALPEGLFDLYTTNTEFQSDIYTFQLNNYYANSN
jgi:Protein of unknown function (Hypoth_ymh)